MACKGLFIESGAPVECFVWESISDHFALETFLADTEYRIDEQYSRYSVHLVNIRTGNTEICYNKTWVIKSANDRVFFNDCMYDRSHEKLVSLEEYGHPNVYKSAEQTSFIKTCDAKDISASYNDRAEFPAETDWHNYAYVVLSKKRWNDFKKEHGLDLPEEEKWQPMKRMGDE